MKLQMELWGSTGKTSAMCRFEVDVDWQALDVNDIEKMKDFEPESVSLSELSYDGVMLRGPDGIGLVALRVKR